MKDDRIKKIISFRCTLEELEVIERLAKEGDRSISGFVSHVVKNYLREKVAKICNHKSEI